MANILKHFSKAFEAYKRNFVPIILSILFIWIVLGLFFGASFLSLFGAENTGTIAESYITSGGFTDLESQELFEQINIQSLGLFFLFLVLGGIVAIFLQTGLWGICFYGIKKKVNMKTFFTTIRERGIPYFFATILVGLIFLAILIPVLVVYIVLYFFSPIVSTIVLLLGILMIILMISPLLLFGILMIFPFFVLIYPAVISGKKLLNSLTESFSLGKKNFSSLMLLFIIIILLALAVTLPSIVFHYAKLFLIYPTIYIILMFLEQIIISFLLMPIILLVIYSFYLEVSKTSKIKVITPREGAEIRIGRQKLKKSASSKTRKSDRGKKKTSKISKKRKTKKKTGGRK